MTEYELKQAIIYLLEATGSAVEEGSYGMFISYASDEYSHHVESEHEHIAKLIKRVVDEG